MSYNGGGGGGGGGGVNPYANFQNEYETYVNNMDNNMNNTMNVNNINNNNNNPTMATPNAQQLQLLQLQQQQQQQQQQVQQQQQQHQQAQQLQQQPGGGGGGPPGGGGGPVAFPQYQQQLNQLQQQLPPQQQLHHQIQAQQQAAQQQQQQQSVQQQQLHQQLQQHQHQLQQQAHQLQQFTASVAAPPPLGDPAGLLGAAADAVAGGLPLADAFGAGLLVGRGQKRSLVVGGGDEDDEEGDDDSFDEDDDELGDDDDEGDDGEPLRKKRGKKGSAGSNKANKDGIIKKSRGPKRVSRRQQPPKTNITRTRYSNDFKMRVVQEIEEPGYGTIFDISKHYGVAEQTLRDWTKNKEKISLAVQRRGNMKANPVNHLEHVTQALLKFMDDYYEAGNEQTITARMIATKGQDIKRQLLEQDLRSPFLTEASRKATKKFSASLSWGKKWVRQYAKPAKTTQVPQDLEGLSKEELVRLLRSVASEREALLGPKKEGDSTDLQMIEGETEGEGETANQPLLFQSKKMLPYIPSPPRIKPSALYKIDQAKTRIADTLASLIKKKGHNWKGRPTTEMAEDVPTLENVRELFEGYQEVNKTARSYRWQLSGEQVVEWLACPKYVHPVKFEGKVVCTIGQNANVYAFAGYDSMLAKYEQGTSTLTLKVKTFTAGTGNIPGCDEPVFLCND